MTELLALRTNWNSSFFQALVLCCLTDFNHCFLGVTDSALSLLLMTPTLHRQDTSSFVVFVDTIINFSSNTCTAWVY